MLRINSTITKFMVLTIIVLPTPFPCLSGGIKGDAELLKTVALKHKANFESLLTWKSEAFEERTSTQGDTYNYMLKSKFTLAYDQLQDAVRWNMEPQEHHAEKNGVRFKPSMSRYNSGMITDQTSYTYRYSGTDVKGNEVYRVIIAGAERGVQEAAHTGLDPRYFYNDAGTIDIYSRLMFLYEQANNPKLTERHVKQEGNHVIMTLEKKTDEGGTRTQRYVFDLSAGGNVVEFYNSGPNYENHRKYEYEEKSGVWVLKSYKKWNTTHHKGKKEPLRSTRTITWSNSVVNVPFEEDEFTLAKMGVRVGDEIQDMRLGMMYIYGGENMLDVLDTADMPEVTVSENGGVDKEVNEVVTIAQKEDSDEVDTVTEKKILLTSEATHDTKGAHRYIYVIIIASVIGLVGVIYKLTHRLLKESDR